MRCGTNMSVVHCTKTSTCRSAELTCTLPHSVWNRHRSPQSPSLIRPPRPPPADEAYGRPSLRPSQLPRQTPGRVLPPPHWPCPLLSAVAAFLNPWRQKATSGKWVRAASLDSLPEGQPQRCPIVADRTDAWNSFPAEPIGAVFLCRGKDNKVLALQSICPHNGGCVSFNAAEELLPMSVARRDFRSPGPPRWSEQHQPPRPRYALDVEVRDGGEVWVKYETFRDGVAEKSREDLTKSTFFDTLNWHVRPKFTVEGSPGYLDQRADSRPCLHVVSLGTAGHLLGSPAEREPKDDEKTRLYARRTLVVIAIIGTLIALLLPALQAAQESGRRTKCQNQQKQLSLAMLNFEAAKGGFPFMSMGSPAHAAQPAKIGGTTTAGTARSAISSKTRAGKNKSTWQSHSAMPPTWYASGST